MRNGLLGGLIGGWPWIVGALGVAGACSEPPVHSGLVDPDPGFSSGGGSNFAVAGKGGTGFDGSPVVTAPRTPPAISGGTLLALREGGRAVVADSDRDRVLVVDVDTPQSNVVEIPLGDGAEPGRLVEDGAGRVHVALRGTGELVTIDVDAGTITARRAVCKAPRGVAYDASSDNVLVACLEGTLVELPAAGGDATRATSVASDLRDVAFIDGVLAVTRFRSAQVLFLDDQRRISKTVKLTSDDDGFTSSVAWRAVPTTDGRLAIAHQRAFSGRIEVSGTGGSGPAPIPPKPSNIDVDAGFHGDTSSAGASDAASAAGRGADGVGGTSAAGTTGAGPRGGAPGAGARAGSGAASDDVGGAAGDVGFVLGTTGDGYGSPAEPCSSVVEGTFSYVSADGVVQFEPRLQDGVLPVDLATHDGVVAVAFAGAGVNERTSVGIYTASSEVASGAAAASGCRSTEQLILEPNVVAVAFEPTTNNLLVQSREPAELYVIDVDALTTRPIALGGESMQDTGHDLFHTDAGGGIACASCHPEGTEDGRVWKFSDVGTRRTQPLDVGLEGTAPFHWDGELDAFSDLMTRIFTERMSGPTESDARSQALERYVYSLPRRPALRDASDSAALRGKALFDSVATGCTTCHSGPKFSNNGFADVGKGVSVQVPSLVAVSARAPYMHDGCAKTLLDRFDPSCGGDAHGDVSSLSADDIGDLVAYLESL